MLVGLKRNFMLSIRGVKKESDHFGKFYSEVEGKLYEGKLEIEKWCIGAS